MRIPASAEGVARAAALLRAGGVVAFPTETVYGLGANAFDALAVARVFEIKRRPAFDPLIVHVLDRAMLERVAAEVPGPAEELIERFWPGALTLVLPRRREVPALVTAGLETVAVRMPSHPVARRLIEQAGNPVAAPSANPFGRLSSTRAEHVERSLGDAVDLILDGGPATQGVESTIVAFDRGPVLLRPGAVDVEAIERIVGPLECSVDATVRAPGQLPVHYAPRSKLRIVDPSTVPESQRRNAGLLALNAHVPGYAATRVLSPLGDLREAAARLFEALHELDALGLERIDAQPVARIGIGLAIMDRLERASAT